MRTYLLNSLILIASIVLPLFFGSNTILCEVLETLPVAMEFSNLHLTDHLAHAVSILKGSAGVYCVKCVITGAMYIGSSICLGSRLKDHLVDSSNTRLLRAILKYGVSAFVFIVIEFLEITTGTQPSLTKALLLSHEQIWLDWLFKHPKALVYNFLTHASSPIGYVHTAEARAKMVAHNLGNSYAVTKSVTIYSLDNTPLHTFSSITAAAKYLGVPHSTASMAIKRGSVVKRTYRLVAH